jgi:hypothetical protein
LTDQVERLIDGTRQRERAEISIDRAAGEAIDRKVADVLRELDW